MLYASQGQYDKARAALELAIRTHPSYATAHENLGDIYAKLASQAYDKALQLDKTNAAAQDKLSLVRELVRPAERDRGGGGRPRRRRRSRAKPPVVAGGRSPSRRREKPAPSAGGATPRPRSCKAVNGWAKAWSKKDVDGYLAYYATDFKTPGGEARDELGEGAARPHRGAQVDLGEPRVAQSDHERRRPRNGDLPPELQVGRAQVQQPKTLVLVKAGDGWLIKRGEESADARLMRSACSRFCLLSSACGRRGRRRPRKTACRDVFEADRSATACDDALQRVGRARSATYPNFRLAHLISGDLLLARARPLQTFGNVAKTVPGESRRPARRSARAAARATPAAPATTACRATCCSSTPSRGTRWSSTRGARASTCSGTTRARRALVADYYISLGKNGIEKTREGDQKTPLGVYHVTANLPRKKLTDFYGAGAFPINYPNEWDRRQGRNGYGIWLHGMPSDIYSRPPRASDGCIVLTNQDLERWRATCRWASRR